MLGPLLFQLFTAGLSWTWVFFCPCSFLSLLLDPSCSGPGLHAAQLQVQAHWADKLILIQAEEFQTSWGIIMWITANTDSSLDMCQGPLYTTPLPCPLSKPRKHILSSQFYGEGDWGPEWLSDLPNVSGRIRVWTQAGWLHSTSEHLPFSIPSPLATSTWIQAYLGFTWDSRWPASFPEGFSFLFCFF